VIAALANPQRVVRRMWGTREALDALDLPPVIPVTFADVADLGRMVPHDAPHQGLVIEVDPLPDIWLGDLLDKGRDDRRPTRIMSALCCARRRRSMRWASSPRTVTRRPNRGR
jgi:23S rRNA (guanosine2251-2'-O)-methyltransferase